MIPLRGSTTHTARQATDTAIARGAQRTAYLAEYLAALYADAATLGLNPDVLVAQWDLETDRGRSPRWVEEGNPAGIGITDDKTDAGHRFTAREAARVHVTHMAGYAGIAPPADWVALDFRWAALLRAGYYGVATTTADLGNGRWATDPDYATKLAERYAAYWGTYQEQPPMATHRFVLNAGHRNINRGGAHREIDWTYPMTKKLQQAIHRRGGRAWITSEEDGDNDPSYSHNLGLQGAARIAVDIANEVGGIDAYISMHYEGTSASARGFFGIFPDSVQGGVDVRANNPLDLRLCRVIAEHVTKTGMPKRTGWVVEPGVMSERQTGVGGQGYRLGEFVGTIGIRDTTPRVILEGGNYVNTTDRAMLWSATWQDAYAEAIVDGLEEVFGRFPRGEQPVPEPDHEPVPQYPAAAPIAALADDAPFVVLDNKATLVRVPDDLTVRAVRDTPRLRYAAKGAATIGPEIPEGEQFSVAYLIVNPDQSLYWYTPWHTRVRYEDTEIVEG